MNESERLYLAKFRQLAVKKNAIVGAIAELKNLCESLNDWEATATDLRNPGGTSVRTEWADDRLAGLAALRSLLIQYSQQMQELQMAWNQLPANEKVGLAEPGWLRPPK